MILLVAAIIGASYYAVVCSPAAYVNSAAGSTFILHHHHYIPYSGPGSVPETWRAVSAEESSEVVVLRQQRMMDLGEDHLVVATIASIARMGSRRGAVIVLFVKDVFSRWTTIVFGW